MVTEPRSSTTAFLMLADGRLPVGGHAHSAGIEAAVLDGRVHDHVSLEAFVSGRLHTTGLVEAALAAATALRLSDGAPGPVPTTVAGTVATLGDLDAEADARILAPPLRRASRRLGRQLARVGARCWPHPVFALLAEAVPEGAHQAVTLGVTATAAGLLPRQAAELAVHHAISTPAQAAVKLLGLDPYAVAAMTASLETLATEIVDRAMTAAPGPLGDLPAAGGLLLDTAAMEHDGRDLRMFAT